MDAGVNTVADLLSAPGRLVVPVYQRPYVWRREQQWEPLWDDIDWLLDGYFDNKVRKHFLGAIVLEQQATMPGELPRRTVIDGQQRLTTLQILLAACAAGAREMGVEKVEGALTTFVRNEHFVSKPEDAYKLWPTENDRWAYELIMRPGGPPADAEDDPSNHIQEAFAYFLEVAKEFGLSGGPDAQSIEARFVALQNVLMQQLQVVSINLKEGDDAQVIFETLNARGTPLLEMDNVKNALFHRANQEGVDVQTLNETTWQPQLGDVYWRKEVRQGRLTRPRAELFLFHWLTMLSGTRVGATELFPAFRRHVLDEAPGKDPAALAETLKTDATIMRGFDNEDPASAAGRYFAALDVTDTTTVLPLTLLLFRLTELEVDRRNRALRGLESFLVRRMLGGHTTKRYNLLFVEMLEPVKERPEVADDVILDALASSEATSATWPTDDALRAHLLAHPLYDWISRPRISYVLWELELMLRGSSKTEDVTAKPGRLSIEHVLPQQWERNWPLAVGGDEAADRREGLVHVLGNLTLVTGELNSSLSNDAWPEKRSRMEKSVLLLNGEIRRRETWDDDAIQDRGASMVAMILHRWPGPAVLIPGFDPDSRHVTVTETDGTKADLTDDESATILDGAPQQTKILLQELAQTPGQRRRYEAVEDALGWSRGRLASVLGGYSAFATAAVGGKRPHRVGQDEDGDWWIWLEPALAEKVETSASKESASTQRPEQQR